MKKIILALTLVASTLGINAQHLETNEIDEFEGYLRRSTQAYQIGEDWTYSSDIYITAKVSRINDAYFITLKSSIDLGCAGADDNYIIFKFTDGTILKLTDDIYDINCAARASSCFRINPNGLLRTKTITDIKFAQSESYSTFKAEGKNTVSQLIERVETATLPTEAELKKGRRRARLTMFLATPLGILLALLFLI